MAEKDESQDFIECEDYSVLFQKGDAKPGDFVTRAGKVLGRHRGIIHYTIGQRKGLELGGGGTPWYVLEIDAARNRVVVGAREELYARELAAERPELGGMGRTAGKTDPLPRADPAAAPRGAGDRVGAEDGRLKAVFDEPQLSVTPGQIAVFYEDESCWRRARSEK